MGGATALRFATRWPERVEALILTSTMASRLPDEIIARAREVERVFEREGLPAAVRFYFRGPLLKGVERGGPFEALVETLAESATPQGFLGGYRVAVERPSMVPDLHRIHAPTLVLVGELDTLYLDDADLMRRSIPGARKIVMPGLGHALSAQAPEAFAKEVMDFLDSLPPPPSG
jgi:pimeloyl-ACP methyl ester carboxylesterase